MILIKKTSPLLLSLAAILLCTACNQNPALPADSDHITQEVTEVPELPSNDGLLLRFSFDEAEKNAYTAVTGTLASEEAYINYVFNNAKYKKSEPAERAIGISGSSLKLDGYSTRIRYDSIKIESGSLTVAGWVAPRTWNAQNTGGAPIVEQFDAESKSGFSLGYGDYGKFYAAIGTSRSNGKQTLLSFTLDENRLHLYNWNFLALTFDGTGNKVTLYLNGEVIKEMDYTGTFINADTPLLIGKSANAESVSDNSTGIYRSGLVSGLIDEVNIYDRALSTDEINLLFTQGLDEDGAIVACDYNELMPSYEVIATDEHIQHYHIRSRGLWQGELTSPFYYNGKYHMFSHRHLNAPLLLYGVWGHYVSDDLIHWEEVLPAIVPSDARPNIDEDHSFSGYGAVDANGQPYLFFTGVTFDISPLNRISYATAVDTSDENLMEWEKSNKVIINNPDFCSNYDFRDPFIYTEGDYAYMLIGTSTMQPANDIWDRDPMVMVYRAKLTDLTDWEELGILYQASRETYPQVSFNWELPEMYRLTNEDGTVVKYMLNVSPHPHPSPRQGTNDTVDTSLLYWLGDFDTETGVFTSEQEEPLRYDMGTQTSATSTAFLDPVSEEWISYSIIHTHYNEELSCYHGYNVFNSIPRVLSLHDDGTLRIRPYEGMESLHAKTWVDAQNITADEAVSLLSDVKSKELHVKLSVRVGDCSSFGLNIKQSDTSSPTAGEHTALTYNTKTQIFTVDASKSSRDTNYARPVSNGEIAPDENGLLNIEFYLDNSTVEIFVNERLLISSQCFSTMENALGMLFYYTGTSPEILNLQIYEMEALY